MNANAQVKVGDCVEFYPGDVLGGDSDATRRTQGVVNSISQYGTLTVFTADEDTVQLSPTAVVVLEAAQQVQGHRHQASLLFPMSAHAGINLGTCKCRVPVLEFEVQGRRIAIERSADKTTDLFDRACSLGYTEESAAKLADCWTNWDQVTDPCMIHPNHSVSVDKQGYAVDGCEACNVLVVTHDAGFTQAAWQASKAKREAQNLALVAQEAAQYAAEKAIIEGNGKDAAYAALITQADNQHGGLDASVAFIGVAGRVTLEPVPTVKSVVWHLNDGATRPPCGSAGRQTTDPDQVTCKRCPGTRRFAKFQFAASLKAARDIWSANGIKCGLVVRNLVTGQLGMINDLSHSIRVGYWAGDQVGSTFSTLADFYAACEFVFPESLVAVGTRLVSNLGGEGTVTSFSWASVTFTREADNSTHALTFSEFAAELSRGWLAIVPAHPTMIMHSVTGRHLVTSFDLAQVGYQVTVAAGSPRNGVMVQVSPWGALVRSRDGSVWGLSLDEMINGSISIWLADDNGRPVGSWR